MQNGSCARPFLRPIIGIFLRLPQEASPLYLRGLLHLRSKTAGPGRSEELLFHQRQVAEVHVAVAIEISIRISEVDDHVLVEIRVADVAESIVICVLLIGVEHPRAIVAGITSRISAG